MDGVCGFNTPLRRELIHSIYVLTVCRQLRLINRVKQQTRLTHFKGTADTTSGILTARITTVSVSVSVFVLCFTPHKLAIKTMFHEGECSFD